MCSKEQQVIDMVEEAMKTFGQIDILVNNSGIGGPTCNVVDMKLADWNEILSIDLTGSMLCAREALKRMIPRKSGAIINIGAEGGRSGDGRSGYPMRAGYCCAKMGDDRPYGDFVSGSWGVQHPGELPECRSRKRGPLCQSHQGKGGCGEGFLLKKPCREK